MTTSATQVRLPLGQLLVSRGVVTQEQIDHALEHQQHSGHSKLLGELLVELGYCTDNQICSALAETYGVPYAPISPKLCDPAVIELLPRDFLEEHVVLPLFKVHDTLTVALSEPSNVFVMEEIQRLSDCKVQVVCATVKDISATLQTYLPAANIFVIDDIIDDVSLDEFSMIENMPEDISNLEANITWNTPINGFSLSVYGRNLLDQVQAGGDTQLPFGGPRSTGVRQPFANNPTGGTLSPLQRGRNIGVEAMFEF